MLIVGWLSQFNLCLNVLSSQLLIRIKSIYVPTTSEPYLYKCHTDKLSWPSFLSNYFTYNLSLVLNIRCSEKGFDWLKSLSIHAVPDQTQVSLKREFTNDIILSWMRSCCASKIKATRTWCCKSQLEPAISWRLEVKW